MDNSPFHKLVLEILTHTETNKTGVEDETSGEYLYQKFKLGVCSRFKLLSPINRKLVIVFYKSGRDIFSVQVLKVGIKITLNAKSGKLIDQKKILRDVSKIGHWGNGDYQVKLENLDTLNDFYDLIAQIY